MEASVPGYDFPRPRVAGCVWFWACFVFQGYLWHAQGVARAVPAKRRVSFTIGLEHEVFIYFALTFLNEAFQGLIYTGFLEFTAWAELLSPRCVNTLITTFQLPKTQEFGLFCETVNRMLLQLCFPGMRMPFLALHGRIRKFNFCPCSPGLLSAQSQLWMCGSTFPWLRRLLEAVSFPGVFILSFHAIPSRTVPGQSSHSNAVFFSRVTKGSCTLWCCHPCVYYKKQKI